MKLGAEDWLTLTAKVHVGEPLSREAREFVAAILNLVRRGEDPRRFAGTMPPEGRPRKRHALVGLHYWLLRHNYGRGGELAARKEVAEAWRIKEDHVRKIGKDCRAWKDSALDDPDGVLLAMCKAEAIHAGGRN